MKKELKYNDEDVDKIVKRKYKQWEKKHLKAIDETRKKVEEEYTKRLRIEINNLRKEWWHNYERICEQIAIKMSTEVFSLYKDETYKQEEKC